MKDDDKMVVRRRFESINKRLESKLYMKNEDIPEIKAIFVCGYIHIKSESR